MFHHRRALGAVRAPFVAAGGAWTPASLPSVLGWWKADANVYENAGSDTAESGDAVVQWNDQIGSHNQFGGGAATPFYGTGPIYTTGQINGLPALVGNSAANGGTGLSTSTAENISLGGSTCSAFGMFKLVSGVANNHRLISVGNAAQVDYNGTVFTMTASGGAGTLMTYSGGTRAVHSLSLNTWNSVGTIFDGTNNTMYVNNVAGTPVTYGTTFEATVSIGIMGFPLGAALTLQGSCAEAVVTSGALGSTDRNSLQTYFATKYGTFP